MLCKIADLLVEIPAAGGMTPRCKGYLHDSEACPDIQILSDRYRVGSWPNLDECGRAYMESGIQFYNEILRYNGMMLHASAIALDGKAYLFSGPSGMGKSTHTRLWQQIFGDAAVVFNDDKPALRKIDGIWYAYGTPWCGKDGINQNMKVPLGGICFLKRGDENVIRPLGSDEAMRKVISQTVRKFWKTERLELMLNLIEQLVHDIPFFELESRPVTDAAKLSFETMHKAAQERNL